MILWLLVWLPHLGAVVVPTPVALPFLRRDGSDGGALPTFVRRSN